MQDDEARRIGQVEGDLRRAWSALDGLRVENAEIKGFLQNIVTSLESMNRALVTITEGRGTVRCAEHGAGIEMLTANIARVEAGFERSVTRLETAVAEVRAEIKEGLKGNDERLKKLELFEVKVVAYASAAAIVVNILFKLWK